LSLLHLPSDRIVRLAGPTDEQLAVALDPPPPGVPVVIRYRVPNVPSASNDVVDDVLDQLQAVALDAFPAWLPAADVIDSASDFDRRTVRQIAHRHAADSAHFGPFLADLAEAAVHGHGSVRRFAADVCLTGLARIIADGYRRDGVVLLVGSTSSALTDDDQRRIAAAFEWLVSHDGVGVWLTGCALPRVDRYPTWRTSVPAHVDAMSTDAPAEGPKPVDYPPLAGRPHPASAAEQTLERCLARCEWAAGRTWNQEYAGQTLVPPIRVDLMWPAERCVVEIDGPDHRGSLKYAADRRRDNGLTLDGFAVLRFTNDEIDDDPARVLAVIHSLLSRKRNDEGNLA
jgi:very-short-patch-repair endonuclease